MPGSDVLSIFAAEIVFLTSELDFQLIFNEKSKTKSMHFSELRALFSNRRTLKSMHRRSVLSTLHFFEFPELVKNDPKKQSKTRVPKKHRKMKLGGSQKRPKTA